MVVVFVYGLRNGDLSNITVGWDADVNACGRDNVTDTLDGVKRPYLYFPTPPKNLTAFTMTADDEDSKLAKALAIRDSVIELMKVGVCVTECPEKEGTVNCHATDKMKADESCNWETCECSILEEDSSQTLPFRYKTTTLDPFMGGNGFCIPVPDKESDADIIFKVVTAY